MSCPHMEPHLGPIADGITDKSLKLYPHHTVFTHLGCVLIRTYLGVSLINADPKKVRIITLIMIMAMVVFWFKYATIMANNVVLWKSYLRMLVAYATALYLIIKKKQSNLAGLIIIVDALIGVQARHTASAVTCGIQQKKNSST